MKGIGRIIPAMITPDIMTKIDIFKIEFILYIFFLSDEKNKTI